MCKPFDHLAPFSIVNNVKQLSIIERLSKSDQLHFTDGTDNQVTGFRLAHPQIAWNLFFEWATAQEVSNAFFPFLAENVSQIIQSVSIDKVEYIFSLLNSLSIGLEKQKLYDEHQYKNEFSKFYAQLVRSSFLDNTNWCVCQNAILENDKSCFEAKTAAYIWEASLQVLRSTNTNSYGKFSLGLIMYSSKYADENSRNMILAELRRLLNDPNCLPDGSIAVDFLLSRLGLEFVEEAIEWFDKLDLNYYLRPKYAQVLSKLVSLTKAREDVLQRLVLWLHECRDSDGTLNTMTALLSASKGKKEFIKLAIHWVRRFIHTGKTSDVVVLIIKYDHTDREFAEFYNWWLKTLNDPTQAQYALPKLILKKLNKVEALKNIVKNLDQFANLYNYPEILRALIEGGYEPTEIIGKAESWLIEDSNLDKHKSISLLSTCIRFEPKNSLLQALVKAKIHSNANNLHKATIWSNWINTTCKEADGIKYFLYVLDEKNAGTFQHIDEQLLSLTAGKSAAKILDFCKINSEKSKQLCYYISRSDPNRVGYVLGGTLWSRRHLWQKDCSAYLWRIIILDKRLKPTTYLSDLASWLKTKPQSNLEDISYAISRRKDIKDDLLNQLPDSFVEYYHAKQSNESIEEL